MEEELAPLEQPPQSAEAVLRLTTPDEDAAPWHTARASGLASPALLLRPSMLKKQQATVMMALLPASRLSGPGGLSGGLLVWSGGGAMPGGAMPGGGETGSVWVKPSRFVEETSWG